MLQITTDISSLNVLEREMLAAFILTFGVREHQLFKGPNGLVTSCAGPEGPDQFEPIKEASVDQSATATDIDPANVFSLTPATAVAPPPPPAPGPVLVPSPPNAAPTANAPVITQSSVGSVSTATPATDKSGLMWDERIHAATKTFTADGHWRKKRGVADELVAQVEAELRQLAPAPPPPAPTGTTAPPPPSFSAATPPPPPAPVVDRKSYIDLMTMGSAAIHANKLTTEEFTAVCVKYGVQSIPLLANRMDLVPAVTADLQALIAGRG